MQDFTESIESLPDQVFKNGKYPFIRVQHIDNNDYRIVSCDMITDEAVKDID